MYGGNHRARGFGSWGFAVEASGDVAVERRVVGEDLANAKSFEEAW